MTPFVPYTPLEWEFRCWVADQDGDEYVPIDVVVSGEGIKRWYGFLKHKRLSGHDVCVGSVRCRGPLSDHEAEVDRRVRECAQPAAVIAENSNAEGECSAPLCAAALECFFATLGREAGNLALRYLARGGVYIAGGGIAGKLFDRMSGSETLRAAYLERGCASSLISTFPLYVARTPDMGMRGCRAKVLELARGRAVRHLPGKRD